MCVRLPSKDCFTFVSEMRQGGQFIPTLMLTARGHPEDVLKGFAAGADDYLAKPFELAILIARLRGLLRRKEWFRSAAAAPEVPAPAAPKDIFTFDGKAVDFDRLELRVRDQVFP